MPGHRLFAAMLAATAGIAAAVDPQQTELWNILTQALHARGPDQASAFGMLGVIGSAESRAVIEGAVRGDDIQAIGLLAVGLTPEHGALYLPDLGRAARAPGGGAATLSILDQYPGCDRPRQERRRCLRVPWKGWGTSRRPS